MLYSPARVDMRVCLQMLDKLLDRTHMDRGIPAPYPASDIGYEVVSLLEGKGLLSGVE